MSSLSLPMNTTLPAFSLPNWRGHAGAAGVAVALHVAVAVALLGHDYRPTLPAPVVPVITTQLVSVPAPVPEPVAPVVEPPPPVIEPPAPPEVVKAPAPVVPTQAELAFKREQQREKQERVAEQKRQRQEQQRQEQVRQEQVRQEQQRQEQLARDAAEAQQRLAAERRAADERARAAAASQQYLPISKKAPEYPQRALDKGVQGDCTVSYTVDTQGRVRDPQVLEGCHPWFAQPSLQAARGFRYQPRVVDGRAVEVPGVKNTFHYSIDGAL